MSDLKKNLGARIQEIRKSKNMTQEKLAELINMDIPNLSNIERGKKFMTAETLEKIVNALNVSEDTLFDFKHILTEKELKNQLKSQIDTLSYKQLQFLSKTVFNLKLL